MTQPNPTADQTALRDRIRRVLAQIDGFDFDSLEPHDYQIQATALAAVLPASVDRADVLDDVAAGLERKASALTDGLHDLAMFVAKARITEAEVLDREAAELRRVAAETRNTTPPAGGVPQPKEA
jgi:hypothetical protein